MCTLKEDSKLREPMNSVESKLQVLLCELDNIEIFNSKSILVKKANASHRTNLLKFLRYGWN